MSEEKPTWTRRRGEPEAAWKAFASFREQRSPRRIQYVTVDGMQVSPGDLATWAKRYDWATRTADYDAHLDTVFLAGKEDALRIGAQTAAAEHLQILGSMREILGREMAKLNGASKEAWVIMLKPGELQKYAETVVKLERLVLGQSTEVAEQRLDLSKLTTEELKTLLALTAKAEMGTSGE